MKVLSVGCGIGGLAVGLFLSRRGHDVTILETDPMGLPCGTDEAWKGWPRRGVAQFRHIHLFNARGRNVLGQLAPDVLDELRAAGAGEIHLAGPEDDELVRLTCRRTTYEWVLRRAVLEDARIRVRGRTRVVGLLGDEHRVVGVRTEDGTELRADLVVDASGRRSALPAWLAAIGSRPPSREQGEHATVGFTRWYKLRSEDNARLVRADLGYAAGVVAPGDNRMFCVTFGGLGEHDTIRSLRYPAAFDAAAAVVPPVAVWTDPDRSTVESGVLFMADRTNRLTSIMVDGSPVAAGVVALGDAAMCTNPGYGRGVGLALVHAACLADVLDHVGDHGNAPLEVARAFGQATERELEPWYHAAVASDRVRLSIGRRLLAGEPWSAIGRRGDDPAVRFARGAPYAAERDAVVARAFHRTFQLLDPPSAYWGNPNITERVEAVWRELEDDPPPRPGPDHREMAELLQAAVAQSAR